MAAQGMSQNMKAIVTGGAGFIGSNLADVLLARGDQVMVIDDLSSGSKENLSPKAEFVEQSVVSADAAMAVRAWKPDVVFHLAAQIDVRRSVREPSFDADINVRGTINMAEAAIAGRAQAMILASTGGAIYGEQDVFPATEAHPTRPVSPYGVSKLCAEHYLTYFSSQSPLRGVFLRFGNVYGPRQDPHGEAGVVAIFAGKMLVDDGKPPVINGDGKQTRDYVFVKDVVSAFIAAADTGTARGAYNIGTSVETDVVELAGHIAKAANYTKEIEHGPAAAGEQRRSVLDVSRAQEELGWAPNVHIAEGLAQTVEWFRAKVS